MLKSVNGIGTRHYGRSLESDDGSYVTTVWFAILFVPVVPLRSERILPLSSFDDGAGHVRVRYEVLGRVPFHWPEIARVFIIGWCVVAWCASLYYVYDHISGAFGKKNENWVVMCWIALPLALLFAWNQWFRPKPKLRPIETSPGSEFSVYRKSEHTRDE